MPSRGEVQPSVGDNPIFPLGESRFLFLSVEARVQTLETKLEGTLKRDCHGEVASCFRLHSKDPAASAELRARLGQVRNSNRHLYDGTFGNEKSAGKQNAPQADVFRMGAHFLVGQLE